MVRNMVPARLVYMVKPADAAKQTEKMTMGGIPIPPLLLVLGVVVPLFLESGGLLLVDAILSVGWMCLSASFDAE